QIRTGKLRMTPNDLDPPHPETDQEKIAVIGCGNWGKNLVRNFYNLGFLHKVCDLNRERLLDVKRQYRNVEVTSRFEDVFQDPLVDGVVISTPSFTHYELAREALV